jgi:hypothetical protein
MKKFLKIVVLSIALSVVGAVGVGVIATPVAYAEDGGGD